MRYQMRSQWLFALIVCGVFSAVVFTAVGQVAPHASGPSKAKNSTSSPAATTVASEGEKVFTANCARCHTPPMTLSPRVTGAVIAHMRVRARLSRKDQELLLKYLAP